jgi:hypothetical protein
MAHNLKDTYILNAAYLVDNNKGYSHFFKEKGYVFQKHKSTTPSNYIFLIKIVSYEYPNFQKMTNMHEGYAYQFFDCIAYKRKLNKEQRISTPRTKPKFVGELNCNSMKNFAQLRHKFLDPATPYTNPPQPTKLITINLKFFKRSHVL